MKYRYSAAFRRQVVEEILSGEQTATVQARRHGISRAVIYDWIAKYRLSGLPSDRLPRGQIADYEARIAALERKIGQLAMENELLKKTSEGLRRQTAERPSVISGPVVSASPKGAGS